MAEFKPMVKMMTTEPTVELKLKKGGSVKKADGGMMGAIPTMAARSPMAMPARGGLPTAAAPMAPSLAARRRAMKGMLASPGPAAPVGAMAGRMKEGGKAEMAQDKAMIKKAFKQHDSQEHKGGKGTSLKLKKGGKFATGGVVNGQGGYAAGGIINTEDQGGEYRNTKMVTSKADRSSAKTGDVKLGNGGGYATGGVAKANGGGYKKGGATKKAYATGGVVDSGRPVAMPQGNKPIPKPVSISQLSGTYKKGGRVAPGNRALIADSDKENATAMRQAKADSNLKYGPASKLKLKDGGEVGSSGYDKVKQTERELEEAMNPLSMIKEMGSRIKDAFTGQKNTYGPSGATPVVPKGSITKTEKSVTVAPGKKRGGCA